MTNNQIKLSLDQLSSGVSTRLNAIAIQGRNDVVERLVEEVQRQLPEAQIAVSETSSRSHIDILSDGDAEQIFAPRDDFDETPIATLVANITELS